MVSPTTSEDKQNLSEQEQKDSAPRSRCHRLRQRFIKLLSEEISINRRVHESLAISNAVELLKLVFLSTSTAQHVPNLLAETLRRYSERDLFAAYSYLREKKIMVTYFFLSFSSFQFNVNWMCSMLLVQGSLLV